MDFRNRCKQHHSGKGDLEFQRSLRKNSENFYWIVSEDDGLEDRSEEQYYLDFYHGTVWCYNHNPSASCPPNSTGRRSTAETKRKIRESKVGKKRPDLSERNRNRDCSGEKNPMYGKNREDVKQRNIKGKGKHWYVNSQGTEEILRFNSPGEGWTQGRVYRGKL